MSRELIDTNVLVRFFTGDPPEMAEKARRLVERADEGKVTLVLLPVIAAEVFYTLESYYEIERKVVAEKLEQFHKLCSFTKGTKFGKVGVHASHTFAGP